MTILNEIQHKHKGIIAEQAVSLEAIQRGWTVSIPIGNNAPYDLIIDTGSKLLKIQVKSAWYDSSKNNYMANTRMSKTNRKIYKQVHYCEGDFDFAIIYVPDTKDFYIIPITVFFKFQEFCTNTEPIRKAPKEITSSYLQKCLESFIINHGEVGEWSKPAHC